MRKGRPGTRKITDKRREEVEQVLLTGDWTMKTQELLAARHEVSTRTIREDAVFIRRRWADTGSKEPPDALKADWLARLRSAQVAARRHKQYAIVGRLMHLEAKALGHLEPTRIEIGAISTSDPRELAATVLDALPLVHRVLGLPAPDAEPMVIEAELVEADG